MNQNIIRVEYFINGFHQPQMSYYGIQQNMPLIPEIGTDEIIPFLQNYSYECIDVRYESHKMSDDNKKIFIIELRPRSISAIDVFNKQYGKDKKGNFDYPPFPFPLSEKQIVDNYIKDKKDRINRLIK
jgi:hypothetical protein